MPAIHGPNYVGGTTKGTVSGTTPKTGAEIKISSATSSTTTSTTNVDPIVINSGQSNVLNKYRSYNYNFTLAALSKDQANNPDSYRNSALKYVVLKSGGKGTSGVSTISPESSSTPSGGLATNQASGTQITSSSTQKISTYDINRIVEGFNQNSPGRFDMFIDDVEIETIMEFAKNSGTTQPTKISFDVIEPYSINGFIESIYVTALAAGWPTYMGASFLLKMEFFGYTDDDVTPSNSPSKVEQSTRYFIFQFATLDVDVTEKGTKYKCTGVPIEQIALGQDNVLKETVTASGKTVGEMLTDFMKNLNEQIKKRDENTSGKKKPPGHDVYDIKFATIDSSTGFNYAAKNKIASSKIIEPNKDAKLSAQPDPGTSTQPDNYKSDGQKTPSAQQNASNPVSVSFPMIGSPTATFADQAVIHECISSVIRDSEYLRQLLNDIQNKTNGVPDKNGMVDYFLVRVEKTNQTVANPYNNNMPYQNYTYVVTPYKIHYYKVPGYHNQDINTSNIITLRNYNYIYTGHNIDVLNFKLQFNTLFYEALPAALGNSTAKPSKNTSAPTNNNDANFDPEGTGINNYNQEIPNAPKKIDSTPTETVQSGGNANQPSDDPYYKLARNMHEAVINSKASMITGEIEILGDPFYLVTGGIGNNNPKPSANNGVIEYVGEGEAPYNYGQLFINIQFKNPIDIDPVTGQMFFDPKQVPFSGVYSVTTVNSTFKDGKFTQRLQIIRSPGKMQDEKNKESNSADIGGIFKSAPNPIDQSVADTTLANAFSTRPGTTNDIIQSGRGLPNPGLPGVASNFTAASGGLGGLPTPDMLPQVSGAVSGGASLPTAGANVFGGSIPSGVDQLASGIRMQQSGLSGLISQATSGISLANKINSIISLAGSTNPLLSSTLAKVNAAANLLSVTGSGIGQGASVLINQQPVTAQLQQTTQVTQTVSDLQSQTAVVPSNIAGIVNQVGRSITSIVPVSGSSGAALNKIVTNVNSISALVPSSLGNVDSLANNLGINPAQLSGLSPNLTSKLLGQLGTSANKIPANVDLSALNAQGVDLNTIPINKLANLPASPPYATAPAPAVDTQFLNSVIAKEGVSGLANVYGVTDISKIPSSQLPTGEVQSLLTNVPTGLSNPLGQLTGSLQGVPSLSGSISSVSGLNQLSSAIQGISPLSGSSLSAATQASSKLNGLSDIANQLGSKAQGVNISPLTKLLSG
jgi:hypothetical protein